tara:strand:- start:2845 stop:3081 length:237 start_codon:yes stop_codon:yes gene_type:complete
MKNSVNTYKTHDMAIAAFLLMKGKKIIDASTDKHSGKYIFLFDDEDADAKSLSLEFLSSECFLYDSFIRMLRGMITNS